MAKFRCERRVKCRSTSSSPSSGNPAISSRNNAGGISAAASPASAGQTIEFRPGELLSKSKFGSVTRRDFLSCDGSDKTVDLLSLVHFGDAAEKAICQFGIPLLQANAG